MKKENNAKNFLSRVIVILLHEFVHSYEGSCAAHSGAAVHQDGLSVTIVTRSCHELTGRVTRHEDVPGPVHEVSHDLGVIRSRHVRPLDSLQLGHQARLAPGLDNSDLPERLGIILNLRL